MSINYVLMVSGIRPLFVSDCWEQCNLSRTADWGEENSSQVQDYELERQRTLKTV
jgi:hypothetical protein